MVGVVQCINVLYARLKLNSIRPAPWVTQTVPRV
jgi:hypothetical protein